MTTTFDNLKYKSFHNNNTLITQSVLLLLFTTSFRQQEWFYAVDEPRDQCWPERDPSVFHQPPQSTADEHWKCELCLLTKIERWRRNHCHEFRGVQGFETLQLRVSQTRFSSHLRFKHTRIGFNFNISKPVLSWRYFSVAIFSVYVSELLLA